MVNTDKKKNNSSKDSKSSVNAKTKVNKKNKKMNTKPNTRPNTTPNTTPNTKVDPIKLSLNPNAKADVTSINSSSSTISGLPNSGLATNIISALSGIFVFLVAPYAVNKLNNPTLGALVNVFPTGVLIALFITEAEFGSFYNKLLFAPIFNVVVNWFVYYFYVYHNFTPLECISLNIGIWAIACVLAFIF
jgi:hypothetical protein